MEDNHAKEAHKGILYGVSVGPGDPELLTCKAIRLIQECEVIAVPRTRGENRLAYSIASNVADLKQKKILDLDFPMTREEAELKKCHRALADVLEQYLHTGLDIAFLSLGDITIYSTFGYVAQLVEAEGFQTEYCPGVTSFCASAAALKQPLVQGREPLTIIPGNIPELPQMLRQPGTKVILKSGKNLTKILAQTEGKQVSGVEKCGLSEQKMWKTKEEISEQAGYFTTLLVKE